MAEETIQIMSLSPSKSHKPDFWKVREHNRQRRITLYHMVVHILAFLIIVPYIALIIFGVDVPQTYSTIVSVVVGFYFARSLFND